MEHKKFQILGVNISAINLQSAGQILGQYIRSGQPHYVCVAPVSTVVSCQENEAYKNVVNGAAMVTPDGMPVVWLAKLLGQAEVSRTYGPDLMLKICEEGEGKGYRHYFFGADDATLHKLENTLRGKFSKINIVGSYAPPFRPLTEEENNDILKKIREVNPDLVWVGLGSPKQDFWMKENFQRLNVPVLLGVGAAFDFISGVKPQAPRLLQKSGLEWLFRLCCEPKRLWRRYFFGNTKFIFLIMKSLLTQGTVRKV